MNNRIIICETSEIITAGLAEIIHNMAGFDVVMRLDSPDRLSERILSSDANVLIINPILLGYSERSLPATLRREHPNLSVVAMLTTYVEESVLKMYDEIIEINDAKMKVVSKLSQVVKNDEKMERTDDVELSKREIDVLVAVAKGLMNKEIADQMNISIHTVISHRKNITRKTGIKSVSGLTVYALLNNLIDENEVYK